jgi:hypothetical protein
VWEWKKASEGRAEEEEDVQDAAQGEERGRMMGERR